MIIERIVAEATAAAEKYGPFRSTHEALGVLLEEFDELKAEIHSNTVTTIRDEAIQVASVALRLALQCEMSHRRKDDEPATEFEIRSGL